MSKGYTKHTGHLYTVDSLNGFKEALYNFYGATEYRGKHNKTKGEVKKIITTYPPYYPITVVIVDFSLTMNQVFIETFDMREAVKTAYKETTKVVIDMSNKEMVADSKPDLDDFSVRCTTLQERTEVMAILEAQAYDQYPSEPAMSDSELMVCVEPSENGFYCMEDDGKEAYTFEEFKVGIKTK